MDATRSEPGETSYIKVRDQLREHILTGVFAPDVRLKVSDLAQKYAVSPMPVREALQQLQGEGLVNLLPQKGARVRKIDAKFLKNMYDIRQAIETMLVSQCIENLTDRDIKSIQRVQDEYEQYAAERNFEALLRTNETFHRLINDRAENPEAVEIINRQWLLIDSLRRKFGYSEARIQDTITEHRHIVAALTARDRAGAEKAASLHVLKAKDDVLLRFAEQHEIK